MTSGEQLPTRPAVRTAAVLGAGLIGGAWATLFAARGLAVRVWDPRDVRDELTETVTQFAATLPEGPRSPGELMARIEICADIATAVTGADVVQENGPERIELKHELYRTLEEHLAPDALICSSTSGIMPTDLAAQLTHPERFLVGHPFNPPHLIPLVEIVPGARTSRETIEAAVAFYEAMGKLPIVLQKEISGFIANRLQSAIFKECVHLVLEGVASEEDVDRVVTSSIGLRWAIAGPFESMHLGGGPGGLRHLLEHLGPGMQRRWASLGQPQLTPEVVERLSSASEQRFAGRPYADQVEDRDLAQVAMLAARAAAQAGRPAHQ